MKRAKQRKFKHPVWFRLVPASNYVAFLHTGVPIPAVLLTGEIGVIDSGFRFIQSDQMIGF